MTPETIPADVPPPTGMSEIARISGVFFEPKKAFTDIAARPRWIVPLLLVILCGFGVSMIYSQKGLMRIAAEQQMAKNPQIAQLPPDQREAAIDRGMKIGAIIAYCIPILIPVVFLIISLVLWGITAGILSAPVRFGQVFAVVCYAQLPGVLKAILTGAVAYMKSPADFNVQNPLLFNPGAFMDPQTSSKFLYAIASWFDLFTIWIILLIAVGLKAAAGKKLSFGGALFAVVLPWALIALVSASIAGMMG